MVVLPAPLGPIRPEISVGPMVMLKLVHSRQAAEVDAQVPHVQNGLLALILLTDEGHGGNYSRIFFE